MHQPSPALNPYRDLFSMVVLLSHERLPRPRPGRERVSCSGARLALAPRLVELANADTGGSLRRNRVIQQVTKSRGTYSFIVQVCDATECDTGSNKVVVEICPARGCQ
jgi:hypothetical protein